LLRFEQVGIDERQIIDIADIAECFLKLDKTMLRTGAVIVDQIAPGERVLLKTEALTEVCNAIGPQPFTLLDHLNT
jgi:hypothetical protein